MLGQQIIIDLFDCDHLVIDDLKKVEAVVNALVDHLDGKIIQILTHRFVPQGISCLALISASHIAIHTWPENGFASIDIFSCSSKINVLDVIVIIKKTFRTRRIVYSNTCHGEDLGSENYKREEEA